MRELRIEPGGDPELRPLQGKPRPGSQGARPFDQRHHPQHRPQLALRGGPHGRAPSPMTNDAKEIVAETDNNLRLCPGYFPSKEPTDREIGTPRVPASQEDFPLSLAVAASACVPGAFYPLAISDMYWDGEDAVRVRLVDGGVQDNQGVQGLLDRDCKRAIVSDASGQLKDKSKPVDLASAGVDALGEHRGRPHPRRAADLPARRRKEICADAPAQGSRRKGDTARQRTRAAPISERDPEYDTAEFEVNAPGTESALGNPHRPRLLHRHRGSLARTGWVSDERQRELGLREFDALGDPNLLSPEAAPSWNFLACAETRAGLGGRRPA